MNAKKYNNIKLSVNITEAVLSFLLLLLFLISGYSSALKVFLIKHFNNSYFLFLAYVFLISAGLSLVLFPLKFYSGFYIEHKFNLSNQSFGSWLWEELKALIVGTAIVLPILLLFFYFINASPNYWWLYFALALFIFSVILAQILPVVVLPLFYKVTPIENNKLKEKIISLTNSAGLSVEDVYKFNMSKNTKKVNAAFTGLGKTKRIILGDTLLENFSVDEIITVVAHELGHFKRKHIVKNIFIATVFSFITFYLVSVIYKILLPSLGFSKVNDIAAFPLLVLLLVLISLITTPVTNYISRKFEYEADAYSAEKTGAGEVFVNTLIKINDLNLGDKQPHPLVELLFYSHPSIQKRIERIKSANKLVGK